MVGGHGQLLLRSLGIGSLAYADAVSDTVFAQLREILSGFPTFVQLHELERGSLVRELFGPTCDPDPDGTLYAVDRNPCCKYCQDCNVRLAEVVEPPEFVDIEVPHVSHDRWNSIARPDQTAIIEQALSEYFVDRGDW
jgi:hypothetical protein